jgi:ankyrin repeat protein
VKWSTTKGPEGAESLNQARIYLPVGATPLYLLATYALQYHDLAAARRLLALGAHADAPVGPADMPAALIPVMEEDTQAIRLLRDKGIDYSKLRYRGITALEFAKRSGSTALLKALGESGTNL